MDSLAQTDALSEPVAGASLAAVSDRRRLDALAACELLDTEPEESFDRVTRLVTALLGVPTALVSLVSHDRQFFKSSIGLPDPWGTQRQTALSHSFCQYVVATRAPLAIEDARTHPVLACNGATVEIGVVSYLGVPLTTPDGQALGALCAIADAPRSWTSRETGLLSDLANIVMDEIVLRQQVKVSAKLKFELDEQNKRFRQALFHTDHGICVFDASDRLVICNDRFREIYRLAAEHVLPGTSLQALMEHRCARGTMAVDESSHAISWRQSEARERPRTFEKQLMDGRYVQLHYQPTPDGGWVGTIEDVTEATAARQTLAYSKQRYKLLADHCSDVIILTKAGGIRSYVSPSIERVTGYTVEEALKLSLRDWVHPDDKDALFGATANLSRSNPRATVQHRARKKDGTYTWVEGIISWIEEPGEEPYVIANIRDISQRKKIEDEYRLLWQRSEVGMYRRRLDFRLTHANPALVRARGYATEQQFIDRDGSNGGRWRMHPERRQARAEAMQRNGMIRDFVSLITNSETGEKRYMSETAWIVRDEQGEPLYIDGMAVDVTEKVEAENRLRDAARRDALTGLANRFAFNEAANKAAVTLRDGLALNPRLLFIDLDRFKAVNDNYGHHAGDDLLRQVADRIAAVVSDRGLVARLGGDEFAVLLHEDVGASTAEQLAVQILTALDHPVRLEHHRSAAITASIGIAAFRADEDGADLALRRADIAMYEAKRAGRSAYRLFSDELMSIVQDRQMIETDLRLGLKRNEFTLHYQPIIDLKRSTCVGYEALARWHHPERGSVSPGLFIPLAEQSGLIIKLGEFILAQAIEMATRLPKEQRISINASTLQLRHPDFMGCLVANLSKQGVDPRRIEIEVTETALLDDTPESIETLQKLQRLGVSVALDDFGTGWSSLSYLTRHRFDRIKIDRSFVQAHGDRRSAAVLRGIIDLAKRLGASLTAEGIETDGQRLAMQELGCEEGQGYLFGRPAPIDEVKVKFPMVA